MSDNTALIIIIGLALFFLFGLPMWLISNAIDNDSISCDTLDAKIFYMENKEGRMIKIKDCMQGEK